MKDARARRIEEVFAAAADLEPAARRAFLEHELADEPGLRADVESLLAHDRAGARFLGAPIPDREIESVRPERIGRYRIRGELGRGGMGIVYLAEQDHPRREVALKVMRPGLATPSSLRRFEREAELLARVQHPHIAQVFEAGTEGAGDDARAFLAMELVRGESLTAFAAARGLGTRERMRLLATVSDAVDHAHRRGVIHRDLKPSNVLVDASSGTPQVKVLDFGIARAIDAEALTRSLATDVGQVVGTLPYMSPEQAQGEADRVGPQSDVYSLGVIGFELACGRLPLDVVGKPLHEALRMLREEEPTPLARVAPLLGGDVDTILAKALEKEPARRYASAAELAADLRRFVDDRPILARRPSRAYVLAKFARRNRALVAAAIGVFAALSLGLGAAMRQAFVAAAERDRANEAAERSVLDGRRAEQEMRRAKAVARFQRDMLSRVQTELDGRDVKLVAVLDAAADSLPGELAGDATAEGGVRKTLGESYHSLGMLAAAERQFRAATELLRESLGEAHEETIDTQGWLATTLADLGRVDEAVPLLERAYLAQCAVAGADTRGALVLQLNLAGLYQSQGRAADAEALARENLAIRERIFGAESLLFVDASTSLASIVLDQDRLDEAEALLRRALDAGRRVQGETHPSTLTRASMLATVLLQRGALAEAEALYRGSIEVGRAVLGDEHYEMLAWKHNLAALLERDRRPDEAEALLREVVEVQARVFGDDHPDSEVALESLVRLLERQGCARQALDVLGEALERSRSTVGEGSPRALALAQRADAIRAALGGAGR